MAELLTVSPLDGQIVVRRDYADTAKLSQVLAAARKAYAGWRAHSIAERAKLVSLAVDAFVANAGPVAEALTLQMGRPIRYSPGEVRGFEERARHMISIAEEALADVVPAPKEGFTRFIRREPVGTVLVIAPWNYPLLTAVNAIVPALMAGNTVILKHSAQTPLCAEQIAAAFEKAGLPTGVFQFVHATHDDTRKLIQAPEVNFVCFTGSVPAGAAVESAAAGRFIGVGLELGGNDPAYVRTDADLAHAADTIVDGAYFNSGQSCCGIQRCYVHAAVYDDFVARAADLTNRYVLGDSRDKDTTLGPVVRAGAAGAVREVVAEALLRGARDLVDPSRFGLDRDGTAYVRPALLVDVDHGMLVMKDECFGPVMGVMKVNDDAEAIKLMNDSPYGLTAAIFTSDTEAGLRIGTELETGTVFMNRCDYLDPALAWTGVKNTGRGATLSRLGYEHLTQPKSYHFKTKI